jgi:hypothetical protein
MNYEDTVLSLLRAAKKIVNDELDTSSTEAVLAVFYRLCIESDRALEEGENGGDDQLGWRH